ncbi:Os07g0471491 [Oryza sativa Japonica Group]|uniref:Os07g0471491 protein n=1 Tax=Oryza sativa subsp. japonica TaxID=39947 RepID=A0A0N7KNE9_ORYSJ|nr:Os07g0471491 [Oryza sativa Japonica Group]
MAKGSWRTWASGLWEQKEYLKLVNPWAREWPLRRSDSAAVPLSRPPPPDAAAPPLFHPPLRDGGNNNDDEMARIRRHAPLRLSPRRSASPPLGSGGGAHLPPSAVRIQRRLPSPALPCTMTTTMRWPGSGGEAPLRFSPCRDGDNDEIWRR